MESPREEDRFPLLCAAEWGAVTNPRGICPGVYAQGWGMQLVELTNASNGLLLGQ